MLKTRKRSHIQTVRKTRRHRAQLQCFLFLVRRSTAKSRSAVQRYFSTFMTKRDIRIALIEACRKGMYHMAQLAWLLVDEEYSEAALCVACENGHEHIVRMFLEKGKLSSRVLEVVCIEGQEEMLRILLDAGAQHMVEPVLLLHAIYNGHTGIAKILLRDTHLVPTIDDVRLAKLYQRYAILQCLCEHPALRTNVELFALARSGEFTEELKQSILSEEPDVDTISIPYTNQTVADIVELEDVPILEALCNNKIIVVKVRDSYFTVDRERLVKEIREHTLIRFRCTRELYGAPTYNDVDSTTPYVALKGVGVYFVKQSVLYSAMCKYRILVLEESGEKLDFVASYDAVQAQPGRNLDGQPVDIRGSDHCQAGTAQTVFHVRGGILHKN